MGSFVAYDAYTMKLTVKYICTYCSKENTAKMLEEKKKVTNLTALDLTNTVKYTRWLAHVIRFNIGSGKANFEVLWGIHNHNIAEGAEHIERE